MLSGLQQRKLAKLFAVYDIDKNGVLQESDYQRLVKSLSDLQGWQPGSPGYDKLHDNFVKNIWSHVQEHADTDRDNQVTMREWFDYHEQMLASKESYESDVATRAALVFEALDVDGNGEYTVEDFARFYRAYGIDESLAEATFRKLDRNGNGELSPDEIQPLCWEFYYSEESEAPGNYFFGPF